MTSNEDLLFVELALKKGVVTQEQVDDILDMQKKLREMGLSESVADLMVKKEILAEKDAEAIRTRVSPKGGRQQIKGYRLVERLGRGGMGSVYKAVQLSLGRTVAVKVLKPSLVENAQNIARLRREARLVAQLRHRNIIQGLDFNVSNGFYYFAMEFVDGPSVKDLLEQDGPFPIEEALRITREVALALEHAHEQGIVHRDIKPGNIIVAKDGSVHLADYGLAKGPLEDAELTQSGVTVGTPQYISPEQARGPSDVDIRTDIYSLGATLYHLVTGRPPYQGETLAHLIQQVLYESYPPPRSLREELPLEVAFLIDKMMARRPKHRFQTPQEVVEALDSIEGGRTIIPAGWQGDFETFFFRKQFRRIVAATLVFLLLGGGAGILIANRFEAKKREAREKIAADLYKSVVSTQETDPDKLDDRAARLRRIVTEYPETPAAKLAKPLLDEVRTERGHWERYNRVQQDVGRDMKREEYAKAQEALRRFIETVPKGQGLGVRDRANQRVVQVRAERDVRARQMAENLRESLGRQPPEIALDRLRKKKDEMESAFYAPSEESRPVVDELEDLAQNLDRAIRGTEKLIGPVRTMLESEGEKDYEAIERARVEAKLESERDDGLRSALASIEAPWKEQLEARFQVLAGQIEIANRDAVADAIKAASGAAVEGRFAAAGELLGALGDRSLPAFGVQLREAEQQYATELDNRTAAANTAWDEFLGDYMDDLGRREWELALQRLERAVPDLTSYTPNPWLTAIDGARELLAVARTIERQFKDYVNGGGDLANGLLVDTIRVTYPLEIRDGNVYSNRFPGGHKPLSAVGLEDMLKYGVDPASDRQKLVAAVLRLARLRQTEIPRNFRNKLKPIQAAIATAPDLAGLTDFTKYVNEFADRLLKNIQATVDRREAEAEALFNQGESYLRDGRWEEAHDAFQKLLEHGILKDTDFVKRYKDTIQQDLEEAKEKLPVAYLRRYYGADAYHRAGHSVSSAAYAVELRFDLEDPAQIARFRFTPGRVDHRRVELPLLGPSGPDDPSPLEGTTVDHVIQFREAVNVPADFLNRHPLKIECPFRHQSPMSISFHASWERPIALVLSLAGTNVVVLSDDGRQQDGRGVHIWQDLDLSRPDRAVPVSLRKVYLDHHPEALTGGAERTRYFQFEPGRVYRIHFEKGEKSARLTVDGRVVYQAEIRQYGFDGDDIVIMTYSPAEIDDLRIEGTIDPEWYQSMKRRLK